MYDEMWVTGDGRFTIRRLLCAASPHLNLLQRERRLIGWLL